MPVWRGRICSWRALTSRSRYGGTRATVPEALGACPAFDLIFIDADKPNNPIICAGATLFPPRTLIIGDNVVRDGEVVNPQSADERSGRASVH